MSAVFPKGAAVRQIVAAPIQGAVEAFTIDQETGEVQYLVSWNGADGTPQSRYFLAHEIEAAV